MQANTTNLYLFNFNLGGFTDERVEYQKSFFLSRYAKSFWPESQSFCSAYGLELATLETVEESRSLLTMVDNESTLRPLGSTWIWIDGITLKPLTKTEWYWTKSGKKLSFPLDWYQNQPNGLDQFCLCVSKGTTNAKFGYNDGHCDTALQFICQRIEFFLNKTATE